jgi:hypothetical protein|tara:strand:- start:15 stop:1073 length:1059 start_codon:yes stop_codon:yes gene_type:complete
MAYTTINDPSAYFHTQLYTGTGSLNSVTNDANAGNFKPDWLYIKNRSASWSGIVTDSTRGVNKSLFTPATDAQVTNNARGYVSAFNTDGFTVGAGSSGSDNVNTNSQNYVAWQWKANGGTTASNSNGTITSTVQANTTAGFSIISYTGNGTDGATIGHGLSQTPQIFFPKCLSTATNWEMYYFPTGGTKQYGYLNLGNAFGTWSHNAPSSTIISLSGSGDSNGNGRTMIGYAFHSVKGYSKIGTYSGNGDSDGPFTYTGFKPAWLMIKRTDASSDGWYIFDSTRSPFNLANVALRANSSNAEGGESIDLLSNGFKQRIGGNNNFNNASGTYLYMAFAKNPLVATNNVIALAR